MEPTETERTVRIIFAKFNDYFDNFFKLKHGTEKNFSIFLNFFNFHSVTRLKHGKLQNTEYVPFRFLVIGLKHGTEQSNQCIYLSLLLYAKILTS